MQSTCLSTRRLTHSSDVSAFCSPHDSVVPDCPDFHLFHFTSYLSKDNSPTFTLSLATTGVTFVLFHIVRPSNRSFSIYNSYATRQCIRFKVSNHRNHLLLFQIVMSLYQSKQQLPWTHRYQSLRAFSISIPTRQSIGLQMLFSRSSSFKLRSWRASVSSVLF